MGSMHYTGRGPNTAHLLLISHHNFPLVSQRSQLNSNYFSALLTQISSDWHTQMTHNNLQNSRPPNRPLTKGCITKECLENPVKGFGWRVKKLPSRQSLQNTDEQMHGTFKQISPTPTILVSLGQPSRFHYRCEG